MLNIVNNCRQSKKIMLHLGCRTTERTMTTMWTVKDSAVTTARWKLPWLRPTHRRTTSRKATPTRTCSSTIIPTIWAAAATSPTWTERWYSTQSTCRSAKCSLKSGITSGIRLTSSMRYTCNDSSLQMHWLRIEYIIQ